MNDITIIKMALAARAQEIAEMLLPRGKKEGAEWRAGSVTGEPGSSLGVHLTGRKAGLWKDFNSGEGGDLLDLWMLSAGIDLKEALKRARDYTGMKEPEVYRPNQKQFKRPPKPKCTTPRERVLDYLREDRNLSQEAIRAYKIGEQGGDIIFPFLSPEGDLLLAKARPAVGGKSACKPTSKDAQPCLFGWQAIPQNAREITIVEGEIDAPSAWDYGHPALSVPFGGGAGAKQQWIEYEFDNLDQFEIIWLAVDDDPTGDEAAEEIAARLGRHRCRRVRLPRKDFNQCLVDGVAGEEIAEAYTNAETLDPQELKRPSDYAEAVEKLFYPEQDESEGYYLPYGKAGLKFRIRPGEMTLWSGYTGDGKSQALGDCCVSWIDQGSRICKASLEMHPRYLLKRMVKQATGIDRPARDYVTKTLEWFDTGLIMYEKIGKADIDRLIEIFDYARAKYGCDQFVLDSLMRTGIAADDYDAQEKAVFKLVDWAVQNNVHIHLVAHSRKPSERQHGPQDTHDIKGAMEIGANAANIIIVWRNRRTEEKLEQALKGDDKALIDELMGKPGVILNVTKQRNGDWEGKVPLFFDRDTYRYYSSQKETRTYKTLEESV